MVTTNASTQFNDILVKINSSEIFYNDKEFMFKDNNGNRLPSLTYNDVTYVPLRSFAEQIGKVVSWEEKNNQISISNKPKSNLEGKTLGEFYSGNDIEDVSLIQLIANPQNYADKRIRVNGILMVAFECDNLFLSREDMYYGNFTNSISLNFRTQKKLDASIKEMEELYGQFVEIEGIFEFKDKTAILTNITYIHCTKGNGGRDPQDEFYGWAEWR